MIRPQKYTAIVSAKEKVSSKVYDVTFTVQTPDTLQFEPGQTIMIHIEPGVNRSMSIASAPTQNKSIRLCWDVSPMGKGCQWLLARNVGDSVSFMAPLGAFTYKDVPRAPIFLATGTGLAPFYSMLSTYLPTGKISKAHLYWGLRFEEDRFWEKELASLAQTYPQFSYDIVLSRPSETWSGKKGYITDYVLTQPDIVSYEYYLCGNNKMVDTATQALVDHAVPIAQVHSELFYKIEAEAKAER